jgi:PPP family 3-phenylpropionic acid transporter
MRADMTPAHRLALFYATAFAGPGASLPFLPPFLAARGLGPEAIGQALALAMLARLVVAPSAGALADHLGDRRRVAAVFALLAMAATALLLVTVPWVLALAVVLSGAANAPLIPIADSLAVRAAARGQGDFGRMRAAGSVSFMAVRGFAGALIGAGGDVALPLLLLTCQAAVVLASLALPALDVGRAAPGGLGALALLRNRGFLLLLVVSGLIQGSHALYYAFSALHWGRAGLDPPLIGALWVESVVVEVLLLTFGRRVVSRLGPVRLLAAGASAAVVRWIGTALTTAPLALAILQPLHAASFAMTMLGTAQLIGRLVPPERGATAQSLHASFGPGLATALLTRASGVLYARLEGRAFLAMAAVAAVALPVLAALARAAGPERPGR